jgi:hypothetical protein
MECRVLAIWGVIVAFLGDLGWEAFNQVHKLVDAHAGTGGKFSLVSLDCDMSVGMKRAE